MQGRSQSSVQHICLGPHQALNCQRASGSPGRQKVGGGPTSELHKADKTPAGQKRPLSLTNSPTQEQREAILSQRKKTAVKSAAKLQQEERKEKEPEKEKAADLRPPLRRRRTVTSEQASDSSYLFLGNSCNTQSSGV